LRTRLIVVEAEGRTVGLIVDSSREFTTLSDDEIKPSPDAIANLNGEYLEGIANRNNKVILVLRLDELLRIADTTSAVNVDHE
jgi:purine-binding chemotaxis protein CheW